MQVRETEQISKRNRGIAEGTGKKIERRMHVTVAAYLQNMCSGIVSVFHSERERVVRTVA